MGLFKNIAKIFRNKDTKQNIGDLEDTLLESGLSPTLCFSAVEKLKDSLGMTSDPEKIVEKLKSIVRPWTPNPPADILRTDPHANTDADSPVVLLFAGVNGVGKTTTIAKLANYLTLAHGVKKSHITFAAGDTFRAAAALQLERHADALGIHCVKQHDGADPAAVIYDAVSHAKSNISGQNDTTARCYVFADTAGRMNTRKDLVAQLQKIYRITGKAVPEKNIISLLVVDGNSGLNTVSQVKDFKAALPIQAIVLSKYDGSSRGGVIMSIDYECHVSCAFLGVGETYDDIIPFETDAFLDEFLAQ